MKTALAALLAAAAFLLVAWGAFHLAGGGAYDPRREVEAMRLLEDIQQQERYIQQLFLQMSEELQQADDQFTDPVEAGRLQDLIMDTYYTELGKALQVYATDMAEARARGLPKQEPSVMRDIAEAWKRHQARSTRTEAADTAPAAPEQETSAAPGSAPVIEPVLPTSDASPRGQDPARDDELDQAPVPAQAATTP